MRGELSRCFSRWKAVGAEIVPAVDSLGIHGPPARPDTKVPRMTAHKPLALTAATIAAAMADPAVAQRRTGYVVGGISPLGQTTAHRLFIDSACLDHETMIVSGGRRGLSVELSPLDLVELTDAEVTDLAQV